MTKNIETAFEDAVREGVFPSASAIVGRPGEILFEGDFGNTRKSTCFDIASLTKPISTATITMMLATEELIHMGDTVYQWLAGARQPVHKKMTIEHLLNHTSGLPAWQAYYRSLPLSLIGTEAGKRFILEECYAEGVLAEPGKKMVYSDIGYMILGEILEQAGDAPLDALFTKYVSMPLELTDTFFVKIVGAPIESAAKRTDSTPDQHVPTPKHGIKGERKELKDGEHRRFAPTEDCPWRNRVIHGMVHDQNAYALGGVAGHAGLFSTAHDLNAFANKLVDCYHGRSDWISKDILTRYLKRLKEKPNYDAFNFGWMVPSSRNSSSGTHFSANTIGHLGYTGCSIWIDLDEEFWVILLTNRIHPSTTNEKIKIFRPKIHNLIYNELIA